MGNGAEIVGDRTAKAEEKAEEGFVHSQLINGERSDSAENEVFEDTLTGEESIYSPEDLHAPSLKDNFIRLDSGNNDDPSLEQQLESFSGANGVQDNNQSPEKVNLFSPEIVKSSNRFQVNDTSFGKKMVFTRAHPENETYSNAENLNVGGETEEISVFSQKVAKPDGKETHEDSENGTKLNGGEETRVEADSESLVSENSENAVVGDKSSIYKSCVDEFESEDDRLNKYGGDDIRSESIDKIREDNGVQAGADSFLAEDSFTYFDVTSENEESLGQGDGHMPKSRTTCKEDTQEKSDFVEDINELSCTDDDDDENNSVTHQVPPSHSLSEPSVAPSLPSCPSGLGPSSPLLEPASRPFHPSRANGSAPHQKALISEDLVTDVIEESDEIREKLQMIRVKFLRVAYRLGQTPHNEVVAQVLYRLGLAEQVTRNTNSQGVFSFDRASVMAKKLEASGQEPLDFTCTIMVIGKTGVGKSATINSIFDDAKLKTDAFQLGTKNLQEVVGTVHGIKFRVIDTPGLSTYPSDQHHNEKILNSIKRFINKTPPDIVLYFDRLDVRNRDYGDVPLLRTVTNVFGSSFWFNAIMVLTHACAAPPDGPNGSPLSYEMFVTQRSHVVQQAIRQAAGDVLLMNPVSLVENHSACRLNRAGQRVLPNGQIWKPQLLLLSFASKILHEANMILKLEDSSPGKSLKSRTRAPSLPFLLSSLLQSRPHLKLPEEQVDGEDSMFEGLEETSDTDDVSDYDELPPFKSLTRSQLDKLSKAQRKAYYEEFDYREKLFFKKQLKEERKHRELLKKMAESVPDVPIDSSSGNVEDESGGPASIPVLLPDVALPNTFDSDYPSHRFRSLDSSNKWVVRPDLETQGWDHDVGYEGLNVERLFAVKDKIPLSVSGQITKDKKDCTLHVEVASSVKHNELAISSVGFDLQSAGKDMAYTLRGDTKFKNFRCNNTTAGLSSTILGDSISAGAKLEDKLMLSKRLSMLISGGAVIGHGDIAYGGRLEATLRDKDYPFGRGLSSFSLSAVDWHGDLALGCNIQSQHSLGRGTNVIYHGNLSNKGSGQVGIRLNTSDHIQMALLALIPIFRNASRLFFASSEPL